MNPDDERVPGSDSDGVMVLSVWRDSGSGFLGRVTATVPPDGTTAGVVTSPEALLDAVRDWLESII